MEHTTIRAVEIEQAGKRHQATYFVEDGIIHANIGGSIKRLPVIYSVAPELTVQSLLAGYIVQQSRKAANVAAFSRRDRPSDEPRA
ncbi:MAG: hypothetical protein JWR51_3052 [Devosia sp.]|uniref:hypothetical protein n=1 Tax=Devosia sp. TaxID=1871048 RepID=UPI0026301413|nr:hypothetical protein [Devosia sp.]MDB5529949.1 hypothetical protein [Devosia sp.]